MQKRNLILSIISGIVLALAMPRPGIAYLAFIGLVPLLVSINKTRWPRAALYGFVAGAVYFGIILYWIWLFGCLPWILLSVVQALYIAIFAAVAANLMPSRIGKLGYLAVPAAWTAMQWARSLGAYGMPWGGISHVLANDTYLIQLASITGALGVEFLVCFANLALAETLLSQGKRRFRPIKIAAIIVAATYIGGFAAIKFAPADKGDVRVAVIQQNLPHGVRPEEGYVPNSFETCVRMSLDAIRIPSPGGEGWGEGVAYRQPNLVVWPESALPADITGTLYDTGISALARLTKTGYLVGGYDPSPDGSGSYNSAHLYGSGGKKLGVYHKVHLVPFGEFVPLRDKLPFLKNYAIRDTDVLPGTKHALLRSKIGKLGINICFESLFPQIAQNETKRGANLLIVTTNDSWFCYTQAARQHMMMSKLRAVENRRWVVRAALTGISAIIDPYGRSVSELGIFKRGVVSGTVEPLKELSVFTRFGQYFAYFCVGLVVLSGLRIFGSGKSDPPTRRPAGP